MGRIIEVVKSEYFYNIDGKNVATGAHEFIVKNDWHCGYMAYDDLYGVGTEEGGDVTYGPIFQRMSTNACIVFENGKVIDPCKHCKGIYNMKDMHVVDVDKDMFVCFCDNDYSPSHEEFKKYLKEVDEVLTNRK